MAALSLIPVRVVSSWDPSSATYSLPRFATCDDGFDYCIKHDEKGAPVRASEWVCTTLAHAVGIGVAPCAIVQDLDRKLLFGSQIFGEDTNDNLGLFSSGGLPAEYHAHIWKTFTFDLFVRNEDRHVNQYKIAKQNRRDRMISFDWGNALFYNWPKLDLPLPDNSNTIINIRGMMRIYGRLNLAIADDVLTRLQNVEGAAMVTTIKQLPAGWLNKRTASEFTAWFGSRRRRERIDQIREGLRNGSYL